MALPSELGSWVTGTSGPPRDSLFCCGARGDLAGAKVMGVDFGDGALTSTVLGTITTSLCQILELPPSPGKETLTPGEQQNKR